MRHQEQKCPKCGYVFDTTSALQDMTKDAESAMPVPGDITVCLNCDVALEWLPGLKVGLINERKLSFYVRANIQRLRRAIRDTRKRLGPLPSMREGNSPPDGKPS